MSAKNILLLFSLLLLPLTVAAQQSCTINDLNFTLDDVNNQNQGLTVHLSMSVKGMLNKTGKVFVFICDENGNYINSTVPNFCTSNNHLCRISRYTPSYQSSKYDDFTTFIPYYVISKSLSNSKKINYLKIKVIVADDNNEAIASKFSYRFSFSEWTNTCLVCYGKGISSCRFCGGFRQRPISTGYGLYYVMCEGCNGTGQGACYVCGGRGNMGTTYFTSYMNANKSQQGNSVIVPVVPYSGDVVGSSPSTSSSSKIPCQDCHGSTLCSWCSGKGWEKVGESVKTCWRCNGYKYCHTCYGKGFIR